MSTIVILVHYVVQPFKVCVSGLYESYHCAVSTRKAGTQYPNDYFSWPTRFILWVICSNCLHVRLSDMLHSAGSGA